MGPAPKRTGRTQVKPRAPKALTMAAAMKIGAALPDVELTTTWGAPTLKLRGRLLACQAINKSAEPGSLVVKIDFAQRDELIAADPATYYVTDHYVPYPTVLVRLGRVHPDALRGLLRMAWDYTNAQAARNRSAPRARKAVRRR